MKLRAKANGNIIERDGDEAKALIAAGIYEEVDDDGSAVDQAAKKRGQYKRRDMQAEK